jgi:phosphoribosylglycinamide formyltransferase-1
VENRPVPLGVLISGRGSNLKAIAAAVADGRVAARIAVVVSNRVDAGGLAFAEAEGISTVVLPHRSMPDREAYDRALIAILRRHDVEWVCLAGFMRVLGPTFCDAFAERVLNIHPSLLPAFAGAHAQRQALAHGVTVSGATVHFVTADLDAGPIVMQEAVPVRPDDDEERLAARILDVEHRLYPAALARVVAGGWRVEGRRVIWTAPG